MNSVPMPLDLVHRAIAGGVFGHIQWDDRADERARYRAVVPVAGLFPKGLFIEVRLFDDDPQDPWVEIVNAHPQV